MRRSDISVSPGDRQRGAAALEFALVSVVMLMLMVAIVGFGAMFWMQQRLSHMAGEGARAALYARQYDQATDGQITHAACRDAASTWGADVACSTRMRGCAGPRGAGAQCIEVLISYTVAGWAPAAGLAAFIQALPFPAARDWLPRQLVGRASVQVR